MRIGIVACEARQDRAWDLFKTVGADYISVDTHPYIGCRPNHRMVWHKLANLTLAAEWAVLMEDDVIVQPGFREMAFDALQAAPDDINIVSFYLGQKMPSYWQPKAAAAVEQAKRLDPCWIIGNRLHSNQCCAIRGGYRVRKMLAVTDSLFRPMDESITIWSRATAQQVAYSWPSLVDHDDTLPSRAVHPDGMVRVPGRVAYRFDTRKQWTGKAITI
jgi:hypothetical protein